MPDATPRDVLKTAPDNARRALERITALYRLELDMVERDELGTQVHTFARSAGRWTFHDDLSQWSDEPESRTLSERPLGRVGSSRGEVPGYVTTVPVMGHVRGTSAFGM